MDFRITGLPAAPFEHLYGLSDDALREFGAERCIATTQPGYPDRIELRDAEPGEKLLLLNYVHQRADNPYRASHAIFIIEGATQTYSAVNAVPEVMRTRPLSLRAFDRDDRIIDADIVDGAAATTLIQRLLAQPAVAYLHAHYARRGCYAARIDRA